MGDVVGECHIGIGSNRDSETADAVDQRGGCRDCHDRSLGKVGHDGGISHEVVDLPIVEFATGGRTLNSQVADHHDGTLGESPLAVGFAVGVAKAVVGTKVGGVIGHGHGGTDTAAQTDGPVEVFTPIGAVATTDVADGTTIVVLAQEGFAKAGGCFELVGKAAIAYHEAELLVVGHGGDVCGGEIGGAPAGGTAVGGIVYPSGTLVIKAAHSGRIGRSAAAHGHSRGNGDDSGVVFKIAHLGKATRGVDVVCCGVVHGRVGMGVAIVTGSTPVDTSHEDSAVEERGVVEGVLLVHKGLLDLGRELADVLRGETAAIAVGDIVARGPADVVEVGDMVG